MSHVIEINNSILDLQLETVEEIAADAVPVLRFYEALKNWSGAQMLSEVTINRDAQNLRLYALAAEHTNGRMLFQTWEFSDDQDTSPIMTMNMEEPWPVQLVASGSEVGEHLFNLRPRVGFIRLSVIFH